MYSKRLKKLEEVMSKKKDGDIEVFIEGINGHKGFTKEEIEQMRARGETVIVVDVPEDYD